jgi:DNA/RNA endonuclease YhcR with UshA esterase domain
MNEKTLLKLALVAGVIGLLILFIIAELKDIPEKLLSEITKENLDSVVKITGTITRIASKEKVTFIELTKPETVQVILFDNVTLAKGDNVEIIGKITEYEGKMEVVAQRLRVIE